ncbi:hypothetical protein I7I53_09245 [Histoplasma capsulatum var. duboisii H88]|uniref:Uncharacterized protein n=1 Tax=Ajellomyces capsulatus (strain H88) TaxID=544711 RepID=A0A8A1L3P3_AJEC8|nr:hypothetical protein I7I53_09245 [Histoplasma capsulatum var. duboisii H88]
MSFFCADEHALYILLLSRKAIFQPFRVLDTPIIFPDSISIPENRDCRGYMRSQGSRDNVEYFWTKSLQPIHRFGFH